MAINVSINGATIWKGGSYSTYTVDTGGIFNLGPTGIVAILGEASTGKPGANEDIVNNWYTPEQMPAIRAKYTSGPIVDACSFLFAPANDAAIPGGAQAVYIYKTNASTRASLVLDNSYGTVYSKKYGTSGNYISYKNTNVEETSARVRTATAGTPDTFDVTVTTIASGSTFTVHIDGSGTYTWTADATYSTAVALLAGLNLGTNWGPSSPFTLPFVVEFAPNHVGDTACAIQIRMKDETDTPAVYTNRLDHSRTIELADGVTTPLAKMKLAPGFYTPSVEASSLIVLKDIQTTYTETDSVGGNIVLEIGYKDTAAASATVQVTATEVILKVGGSAVATFIKTAFPTLQVLVNAINMVSTNWNAAVSNPAYTNLSVSRLDTTGEIGCISSTNRPARIRKNAYEVSAFFAPSSLCEISNIATTGLPDEEVETLLSGGVVGATPSAEIANGLEKLQEIDCNIVVPLFSRDATEDFADYLTDPSSTYTIDGINQAVKTHLSLMGTIKQRSERQAVCSYKATYADCKTASATMSDGKIQMTIQDIKQLDSSGTLKWFQPWALSCLVAGARCGSPIGTPLLFKYLNCSGIRQTGQGMLIDDSAIIEDFNPRTQYDDAIQAGIFFLERPQSGGFRVVCDNTTYGTDANWLWNRGNVIYAAFVLMKDFRRQIEDVYVGVKNTVSAAEVRSTCDSVLRTYLGQGITVATADAPGGYKNLAVRIEGNTIYIDVTVILVEGIEWIISGFTITRAISE
jgi:hypothetical protein